MNHELTPIPDYGELMTLKEFTSCCESGGFIDYDGTGYFASEEGYNKRAIAYPSEVIKGVLTLSWVTHVMWFNK